MPRLIAFPTHCRIPRYARLPGVIPAADDNPFGAFARVAEIPGEAAGPLAGKRIVVKDCVCVAGVPMMNGSSIFEGYVPEIDATIVTRMLDAGGTIVGKAANEDYCYLGRQPHQRAWPGR